MSFQTVFQRYELKYLLTQEQKKKILQAMAPYMELDQYGRRSAIFISTPEITVWPAIPLKSLLIKRNCV